MKISNKTAKLIVGATLIVSTILFANKALHEGPVTSRTSVFEGKIYLAQPVPILMYHDISEETKNRFRLPAKKLEEQFQYLQKNNFSAITLGSMIGGSMPRNSVVLTFDDISIHFYKRVFPLLKKYNIKATAFVIVGDVLDKGNGRLTWDMIREMEKSGLVDIQSHTFGHPNLKGCSLKKIEWELRKSKELLENNLNKKIDFIAWPYGKCNQNIKEIAKKVGYTGFVGCDGFLVRRRSIDLSNIGRFEIKGNRSKAYFEKFMNKFWYSKDLAGLD